MDNTNFQEIAKQLVDNLEKSMRIREELLAGLTPEERQIVDKKCAELVENLWK